MSPPPFGVSGFARLFEGEGTIITSRRHTGSRSASLNMRIVMVDRDVIEAVQTEFGGTVCTFVRRDRPDNQPCHQWDLPGARAAILACRLLPYLFARRRQQVHAALAAWAENRVEADRELAKFRAACPEYQYDPELKTFRRGCE